MLKSLFKLWPCLFISFFSIAEDEKRSYDIVSKDGQTEVYVRETSAAPLQNNNKEATAEPEEEKDSFFCTAPMQDPIKQVVMQQLNKPCQDVHREDLKRMRGLTLDNVYLESIGPDDFAGLDHLTHLEFHNNYLKYIHPESFKNLRELNHLSIRRNRVKVIDQNLLSSLMNLNYLDLSYNVLLELPQEFLIQNPHLTYLDLSNNLLKKIAANTFSYLTQLKYLDLSNNKLTEVEPSALTPLTALMDLDMSGNQLKELNLVFFENLIKLDLSYNQLSSISWFGFGRLIELDVSYNQLNNIPWHLVNEWTSLDTFNYVGNNFHTIEVHPTRDAYDTGIDKEWYDCWLVACGNIYAYISVNKERYKFMRCRGGQPHSRCTQLSEKWREWLDAGHTLILKMEDKFIKSVKKKDF